MDKKIEGKFSYELGRFRDRLLVFMLQKLGQKSLKSLQRNTINAAQVQQKVLIDILQLQKNTEYGKRYNFAAIRSVADFRTAHPLSTYEHYESIIDNIANGGKFTQLVSEPIILFQETSGTTGKTKLIPRTKRLVSTLQKAFQAVGALFNLPLCW